jgi:CRISPR type IV-associated protein Csf3
MKPLKITMFLSSPLAMPVKVQPYPLMLDSIIIELMTLREGKLDYDYPENDPYAPENNTKGVPLAVGGKNKKFYLASAMEVEEKVPRERAFLSFVKRTDWPEDEEIEQYANWNRTNIATGSGTYRNAREILPGILAPVLNFYCVGDKEAVTDILSDLTAVGVKTSIGMGKVEKVIVVESEDHSIIDRLGNPARPIPLDEHPGNARWLKDYCTYKPPYWLGSNKDMCWIPPIYRWYPI